MTRMPPHPMRAANRAGFTLLELLLVMALIVVLVGLAGPALRGRLEETRLREAGDALRVELARTRLLAMQSGVTHEFRYRRGDDEFRIAPETSTLDAGAEDLPPFAGGKPAVRSNQFAAAAGGNTVAQRLPGGVTFADGAAGGDDPDSGSVSTEADWSEPIRFYPNGTTSDAQLEIANDRSDTLTVRLRGLTGVARVGPPVRVDQAERVDFAREQRR